MAHRICRSLVFLLPLILLVVAAPARAQTGTPPNATPTPVMMATPAFTPPPRPVEKCFEDGLSACLPEIWSAYGAWGVIVLLVVALIIYFISPVGERLRVKVGDWFDKIISRHPAELQLEDRPLEEYVEELDRDLEQQSIDPVVAFSDYLRRLEENAEPLRPREADRFVPLSGSMTMELRPRIGFSPLPDASTEQATFKEQATFPDLTEALQAIDPRTGSPYPAFALRGEPGAGKSTLLRKLARDIVGQCRADPQGYLPVYVSLSKHRRGKPIDFLRKHWRMYVRVGNFNDMLADGRIWLFADGLNEMERQGYNVRVEQWRELLRQHFAPGRNRAVVACRTADYGEGLLLPRLDIYPMNPKQIQEFLQKYIPTQAKSIWSQIERDAIEKRGDLYRMAQIPFWLVIMTEVSSGGQLPRNRAALMGRLVLRWLDYEADRPGGCQVLAAQAVRQAFLENMISLAWIGLRRGQNYEFAERYAEKVLAKSVTGLSGREALRSAYACSLLVKAGGSVKFYHQLFQEYFASHELARRFKKGEQLAHLWRIPWRKWKFVRSRWDPLPPPPSTFWEEATVLAAGMLGSVEAERLTLAVLRHNPPLAARCVIESGVDMSETIQRKVTARLQVQIENPRQRLAVRLAAGKALGRLGDPRIMSRHGEALLPSGKKVKFIEPDWLGVPAGVFRMGSDEKEKMSFADECPAHPVTISRDYKIARFPVTVAEYRCFMDAGGYAAKQYWPDDASLRWLRGEMKFEESYQYYWHKELRNQAQNILPQLDSLVKKGSWAPYQAEGLRQYLDKSEDSLQQEWQGLESEKRDDKGHARQPWLWDDPRYTIPNQPVVGICWYEARAYTMWLTEVLRAAGKITAQQAVCLPTEAEWERAARGLDGRLWPWGNNWQANLCNSLEGRVQFSSPVGVYSDGASPCGALDMAGNVWEWCQDWYDPEAYQKRASSSVVDPIGPETGQRRVARGGSWSDDRDNARCAYRGGGIPGDFYNYLGFRLVLSPI